jgi:hypothetical protein
VRAEKQVKESMRSMSEQLRKMEYGQKKMHNRKDLEQNESFAYFESEAEMSERAEKRKKFQAFLKSLKHLRLKKFRRIARDKKKSTSNNLFLYPGQ